MSWRIRLVGILPSAIRIVLRRGIGRIERLLLSVMARSGVTASLYYLLFNSQFRREHRAVMLGQLAYWRSLDHVGESSALLRRNVHRLEKGLTTHPQKSVFGESYIGETVTCYARALTSAEWSMDERRWATDVLRDYFDKVGDAEAINAARDDFGKLEPALEGAERYLPYAQECLPKTDISYEQLLRLFQRRRAVRWYEPRPVPMELIRQAVNAASLSPSACNRQPYRFLVVRDPNLAPSVARFAIGTTTFAENVPCVIAVVGDLSAYPLERDRHVIYIDAALASMSFMLALETLGLSSCPVNWPDIEEREQRLAHALGLRYHERPILLITVGYADPKGLIPFSQKKSDRLLTKEVTPRDPSGRRQ